MIKLFNTLTLQMEEFTPIEPGKTKLYVCGPTVYDDAHLGHARCYLTWDVLFRFLQSQKLDVTYVRNVTDVDDKILNRAAKEGKAPSEIAETYLDRFEEDMKALNILPPTHSPRATAYIGTMIEAIQALVTNQAAYITPDGSAYFRTAAKPNYGQLSKKPLDDLRAGARVEVNPDKESPLDFALWKATAADDPNYWDTPWGKGRPGWHLECSAMNHALLGEQIDIHAGGADLVFPHHENEIAQTECWTGKAPFSRYWLHNGFVNVSGEKMSKSLGNFSTIRKVLERYDANTIRYFLLSHHYRSPVDFNDEALEGAKNRVEKIHREIGKALKRLNLSIDTLPINESDPLAVEFISALSQDLDTPVAMSIMDKAFNTMTRALAEFETAAADALELAPARTALALTIQFFNILGFSKSLLMGKKALPVEAIRIIYRELTGQWLADDGDPEEWLLEIIEYRKKAKAIKNWTQADAIRKHLSDIGITLMDSKDGTTHYEVQDSNVASAV